MNLGNDLKTNVYKTAMSESQLKALRRKLAKRANQRLVRLERASSIFSDEKYIGIGASAQALEYLNRQGRRRYSEVLKPDMSGYDLKREITHLQSFLSAKTSTVKGLREIEKSRRARFESGEYGSFRQTGKKRKPLKFASTKEFYDFFGSSTFRALLEMGYTSEQIIEAFDTAMENYEGKEEEAIAALEEAITKFREKGEATLKDLREAVKGKKNLA